MGIGCQFDWRGVSPEGQKAGTMMSLPFFLS
jgi:hypothetical protein